jgi:hypothetical protein
MPEFSQGANDITATLDNVIEHLQGDTDPGGMKARAQSKYLLDEIERFLGYTPDPEKDAGGRLVDHAAEADINRAKLERLKREVRAGRADILSGNLALALRRLKEAREYWMKPATQEE